MESQETFESDTSEYNVLSSLQTAPEVINSTEMQQFSGLFIPLPIRYHIGPIVAIATCPRKPLLATCGGNDRTLLVWNLAKRSVIASEKLTEPVNSCSFHPSGDLLAVGTSEKLLLYSLTFDSLVLRKKWENSCTCVSFSNGGHLLAFATGALIIKVISTYSARTVTSLRGHNLSVKSITWAPNDAFFISSGLDGNVFMWSSRSWDRESEVCLPSQCISALLNVSEVSDNSSPSYDILVATSNNTIYYLDLSSTSTSSSRSGRSGITQDEKMDDSKINNLPKLKIDRSLRLKLKLTSIALPVHFSLIFGDTKGNLQVIPNPLPPRDEEKPFDIGTKVAVHTGAVHCIIPSSDGQTLFTASEDGSIMIFYVV